jgi:MtN3 and saliva related transmembrane protein
MDCIFIVGILAGTFTTIAFLPQVIQAYQSKHTKDLSLLMFVVFSTGLVLWIVYGIILKALPVILANSVTLLLCLYLIYLKLKYD